MNKKKSILFLLFFIGLLCFRAIYFVSVTTISCGALFFFTGCEDDSTNGTTDPVAASKYVEEANELLEEVLFDLINEKDIEKPNDIDLTEPYDKYVDALQADQDNSAANFGAGILEVVMLSQDNEIQDYFDRVEEFFDNNDFFIADNPMNGPISLAGPVFRLDQVSLPVTIPLKMTRNMCDFADADPTFTEFQNILVNEILPKITTAIERLKRVTEDHDFTFNVTPKMQGDLNEDTVELDLTEVYATLSALQVSAAFLNQFTAYNFNFESYTGEGMLAALTRGSPFMALHPEGAARMNAAGQALLGALESLEDGIDFLEKEEDFQGDDLIRLDPYDDITQDNLDTLKHYIPLVRNTLTDSELFEFDFDGDIEEIRISLASFYNSPVQDMKELIPPYTVSLEVQGTDWIYHSGHDIIGAEVDVQTEDYYRWYRYAYFEDGEMYDSYEDINIYVPEWDTEWDEWKDQLIDKSWASLTFEFYGHLDSGSHHITCNIYYSYDEPTQWRYVPKITWEADSFSEWVFPDPTFGGLLPGMTDDRFKQIFNIDGEGWQKSEVLELW